MNNKLIKRFVLTISLFMSFASLSASIDTPEDQLQKMLSQHKGQVVYLDFWASWCGPCRKSFPWMNMAQSKYSELGFSVISINLDTEMPLAKDFLKETPASFPVIYDPDGTIAQAYKIKGMPSSYLIDRDGNIAKAHTGFFTNKQDLYQQEIENLLSKKADGSVSVSDHKVEN